MQGRLLGLPDVAQTPTSGQHSSPFPHVGQGPGGVGGGGVGVGPPPPSHPVFHQHTLPPLPHESPAPSVVQSPPAAEPSAQIVAWRGSFLAHRYLACVLGPPPGRGRDTATFIPSDAPCANLTGAPGSAYDDDREKTTEERQSVVAGSPAKVKVSDEPSATIPSTPPTVAPYPEHEISRARS